MNIGAMTLQDIVTAAALISALIMYIKSLAKPIKTFEDRMKAIEDHQDNDNKRLKQLENDTRMILKATRVLIAHSVTDNNTGELKQTQQDIDDYLISK